MAKKKLYKADYYASIDAKDNYGTIFTSMLKSKAFQDLTPRAQTLYVICRAHAKDNGARRALYKFCTEHKINTVLENYFILTTKQAEEYGYSSPNKTRYLKELESGGFIKKVLNNYTQRKANLYEFSDAWKPAQDITGDAFGIDKLC